MILDLFKSKSEPAPNPPFPRCQHRSPAGRRCSQPICSTSPQFCFTHKAKPEELITAELTEAAGSLSTPEEIHNFLTRVTLLRIQGRLTPKESCAYAYLCQILQRGQREIAFHQKLRDDRAEHQDQQSRADSYRSWRLPHPNRSDPVSPEPRGGDSPAQEASSSVPAAPSDATATSVEVVPPAQPVSAQTSTSSTATPSPDFYNHFYPFDPTLPPGLQDPRKNIPPPDEAECRRLAARRGLNFNRRRPNSSGVLR